MKFPCESPTLIPTEPKTSHLPLFLSKKSNSFTSNLSKVTSSSTITSLECPFPSSPSKSSNKLLLKSFSLTPSRKLSRSDCACAHVLVADDDYFQHLYYYGLFNKSLDLHSIGVEKEDVHIQLSFSGEELLEKLEKIKACGCEKVKLIILDYQMGDDKLNGVATAQKLRESGYRGPTLLRTSEKKEDLCERHENFDILVKDKVIDTIIPKSDSKLGKEMIEFYYKGY